MAEIAPGCLAFDEDLSAWIDGELDAPRRVRVEEHLASCRACTARVEQLQAVDRALLALPTPAVGADLRERVADRLAGARAPAAAARRAPSRARRRFAAALALPGVAAAALALTLVLRPADPPERPSESVPIARAPELPAAPSPAIASGQAEAPAVEPAQQPPAPQLAARAAPSGSSEGELEALDPEELAVVLELDTIEDLPVIANLEVLERLLADEAG